MQAGTHQPVLLNEVVEALNINPDGVYLDCTFGRGGHSKEILSRLNANGRILAIDQDTEAVTYGKAKFLEDKRITILQKNFSELSDVAKEHNCIGSVNGILFDLGVSSPQLDDPQRGFSFMHDGPLDMRMRRNVGLSAADWLQSVSMPELEKVLREYGQERYAKKIARTIVETRNVSRISTTNELAEIVKHVVGRSREHKHPATRTFQAIRIYINKELEVLSAALECCAQLLVATGRLLVITFHSLEDQIVKNLLRNTPNSSLPRRLPIIDESKPQFVRVCKPIRPSSYEIENNPRARSSKLYVLERAS